MSARRLSITTVDNPKGTIMGPTRSFTIYTNDQLTQSKDWNDVIVAYRNGAPLRVRDIGQAVTGPQDTTQAGWADGKRGMVLVIFKQPGANVIDTVDKIMAQLPRLRATMPPAIKIFTLSDRTQTIRAAVKDVQFTLLITIALVVMVIFIFLRSLWATVIPSITVPLALLGACALMWFAGYSLDNLSLMALTIAVGFVVDDAIVMLENITRYVEEGEEPFAAALKGSREIAFTIISISISLIAVLIPLLLMGGIMGRLFREFSVTLSMTIVVSAFVSLTLTPMMASRFLKPPKEAHHGRLYAWSERAFDALLRSYERGLDRVLRHRFITLCVFFATLGLSVYLFMVIPKGFFPQQDIGLITGIAEGAQDISPADMLRHLQALGEVVLKDPDVDHLAMFVGGSGNPTNNGRMFITLKPRDERTANADQIIARLRAQARQGRRREAVPAGGPGRARRRASVAHPVPIYAARPRRRPAQRMGAEDARKAQEPCLSCAMSPPTSRRKARRSRSPSIATRPHATASRRSSSTTRSTTLSASARSASISRSFRAIT